MEINEEILQDVQNQYLKERYQELKQLTDKEEQTTLVWDRERQQVCIRKVLRREQGQIYELMRGRVCSSLPMIYEILYTDDSCVLVREYCSGVTFDRFLQETGALKESHAVMLTQQILRGLQQIHDLGLVHRDIHPGNILVSDDGQIKIIDLGIARRTKPDQNRDTRILGTVGYAAPEQFGFQQTDARADIYSVGVLLKVMLTGDLNLQRKYTGKLQRIIEKCTQMNPRDRYKSVSEFSEDLERFMSFSGVKPQRGKNYIPGFRTGVLWKKIIAIVGYILILLLHATLLTDAYTRGGLQNLGVEIAAMLFACWLPLMVMTNFMGWSRKLWPFSKMSVDATIALRIVIPILSIYVGMELDTLARTV